MYMSFAHILYSVFCVLCSVLCITYSVFCPVCCEFYVHVKGPPPPPLAVQSEFTSYFPKSKSMVQTSHAFLYFRVCFNDRVSNSRNEGWMQDTYVIYDTRWTNKQKVCWTVCKRNGWYLCLLCRVGGGVGDGWEGLSSIAAGHHSSTSNSSRSCSS